ncbi:hypothetical protein ITJ44_14225 [Clavibacter sp. VKM Ac-2873]|uniref:hypothetical protein n=1 Tax=Clavibacter sp. VKM Ac-2873 TaxID=2783813 RepID=UPI00188C8FCD|nr:hypothetical protein [Clavibacter sp. VKM Ac-2873]MBF4619230.1 hypothetical protein [Clavibacter sp. VKM Ac-2873]
MKIKNRVIAMASAVACASGIGLAGATPAQAATPQFFSISAAAQDPCVSELRTGYVDAVRAGYRITQYKPCAYGVNGFNGWTGSFYYG